MAPDVLITDDEPAESPAERFARSRDRAHHPHLSEFAAQRPFVLDKFQTDSCRALEEGRGVLVCAPTGAGKTVVGEFAVYRALVTGGKCFYTTPIKALSNQKYADLVAEHGAANVGLLTGDTSINSHAPIVVMTTEVLRNMLYAGSADLTGLTAVVLDEIHYLADKFRGAVWEEVILHLPPEVQLVGLSATVSNAEEFGAWLHAVRGRHHGGRRRAPSGAAVAAHAGRPAAVRPVQRGDGRRHRGRDRTRGVAHRPDPGPGRLRRRSHRRPVGCVDRPRSGPRAAARSRRSGVASAGSGGRHRTAGRHRPAARHHLHLLPGRLRRRGGAVRAVRACG